MSNRFRSIKHHIRDTISGLSFAIYHNSLWIDPNPDDPDYNISFEKPDSDMAIALCEFLNKPKMTTLISPIDCKHRHTDLLHGSRVISTNEYSHSNIYLCLDCGQFMIRGMMNGEYYSIDFTLVRDEHLEAAGKAVKYYSQEG